MGKAAVGEPEAFVEADGVEHQRFALPLSHRTPEIGGCGVIAGGKSAAVQIDETPVAIAASGHHEDPLSIRVFEDLHAVRCLKLPGTAGRKAAGHGIVLEEIALAV